MSKLISIKAASESIQQLLQASACGQIKPLLEEASFETLQSSTCSSGCTALHWAAGSNQTDIIRYLVFERGVDVNIFAKKKSKLRTPLHYACRNGALDAVRYLVEDCSATVDARAKNGVTPFQLAVWQNNLEICKYLVHDQGVDPTQLNDFSCGAVHWIGLCPSRSEDNNDGIPLLPMVKWLKQFPGIDFTLRQRQGHSPLHKAAWGGHIALISWLRDECGLMDDTPDQAGNYAADLADMANTVQHSKVAQYLRHECSPARGRSCKVLGVDIDATHDEIRKAYLERAKEVHPDRCSISKDDHEKESTSKSQFEELKEAYEHLTKHRGIGSQSNPAHSLNLMLELQQHQSSSSPTGQQQEKHHEDFFQARLTAVLLEYGDRGLDLSNIQRKWKQVWPETPCPWEDDELLINNKTRRKKGHLLEYIKQHASNTVKIKHSNNNGNKSIRIYPKVCTQLHVAKHAASSIE